MNELEMLLKNVQEFRDEYNNIPDSPWVLAIGFLVARAVVECIDLGLIDLTTKNERKVTHE